MTKIFSFKPIVFIGLLLIASCSNGKKSKSTIANNKDSKSLEKELDDTFKKMWQNVTLTNATEYFRTDVSDDFFTINADGIIQNKEQLLVSCQSSYDG